MTQADFGFEGMAPYVRGLERLLGLVKDHVQAERETWIERESIEAVFGLGGGELADRPWEPWRASDAADKDIAWSERTGINPTLSEQQTYRYHYDGVPEYAGRSEFPDLHDNGVTYRTVVTNCLFGEEPEVLHDRGDTWKRVASFRTSGEAECPMGDGGGESIVGSEAWRDDCVRTVDDPDRCPLCEEERGESHGHVYLGEGWCEVVYRTQTFYCADCGDEIEHDDDDPRDPDDQVCGPCGDERAKEEERDDDDK